jgi:hypothetical protein
MPVVFTATKNRPSNDASRRRIASSHVAALIMPTVYQTACYAGTRAGMTTSKNDRRDKARTD